MSTKELVERLRKASRAIYLATEETVADDISSKLTRAADTIERLERERDELLNDIRIGCANIECAEAELTTLRARVQRLEEGNREIIACEDKAWMTVRAYRTAEEAEVDDVRNETWTKAADIARAALTEEQP